MYHVHNTQDLIQQIEDIKLHEDQCMMSFDVKALFTSVPIKPAISTIKKLLEEDPELHKRTSVCEEHHQPAGVLSNPYLFHLPRQVF